jgi:hypothetical protein
MEYCAIFHQGKHIGTMPKKDLAYAALEYMKDVLKMLPLQIESTLPSLKIFDFWSTSPDTRHVMKLDFGSYGSRFCKTKGYDIINDLNNFGFFIVPITKQKLGRHDFYTSIHAAEFIRKNRIPLEKNSINTFRGNMGSLCIDLNASNSTLCAPNICLKSIETLIIESKWKALRDNSDIWYDYFPNNFVDFLVRSIPVCIVTEDDKGPFIDKSNFSAPILTKRNPIPLHRHKTAVMDQQTSETAEEFLNCQSDLEPVQVPEPIHFDKESTSTEALGVYIPQEGIIFIWIDRIMRCAKSIMDAHLLFQEVLLHEFFHAFFDIQWDGQRFYHGIYNPSYQSSANINGQSVIINEETIDNALVLLTYDNFATRQQLSMIYDFIARQPQYYREASYLYQETYFGFYPPFSLYDFIRKELIKLLETK